MFLFAHKTKTPTSTYTDSYRVPSSIKQSYEEPPLKAWEENKFVTQGLTQIATKKPVEQRLLEGMTQRAPNQFASQPPIPSSAYLPHKYWISEAEGAGREVQPGLGERGQVRDVEDGTRQQRRLEPLLLSPAAPAQVAGSRQGDGVPADGSGLSAQIRTAERLRPGGARGGGEHDRHPVPKPTAVHPGAPARPGPAALPGLRQPLYRTPLLPARHGLLRGRPAPQQAPAGPADCKECPPIQPQVKDTLCCLNPPSIILPLCQP
ncbi:spermatid-specific manchette-related protein 1 isoform X3 [Ornithorhynchus anatinus]|uniref:spermatid-specific manchette-related protein 1 isoform X3 n=1 Tax=Ornithorhynchus anatinus TaxID=9258 RepID=UPI0019D4C902|nr:spermatid-specific manchette-related protein 1 isoform X3 [Ornithorhynchus anatinus]